MKSAAEDEEPHPLVRYCHADTPYSELICPICWELLSKDVCITCCGHIFHADCLLQWFECSKTCPQCRIACGTFHRIVPIGSRVDQPSKSYTGPADPDPRDTALADTFWIVVAFFLFVLCCRMAKKSFGE
uniref:Uncharacterized protein n=1 Tax=Anopheles arabiensis TaxID=7173 RepID=A0A182I6W6_ANOAR